MPSKRERTDNPKRRLLNKAKDDYGSNINEHTAERTFTPEYSNISAHEPGDFSDSDPGDFDSIATRVVTPTFNDRLLSPPPKVTGESEVKTKLYKRRWYVLVVFSLFAFTQNVVWNTWGPISASSEDAFGWDDGDITLLTNWGPISFIVGALFFSWLIDRKGMRWAVLTSMALITAGCGIRCITSTPPLVTWVNNIACALNGLGGPVAMFGPPVISTTWFGPHERTTATALSIVISAMGLAVTFLLGPFMVPVRLEPNCTHTNSNLSLSGELGDRVDCAAYLNHSAGRIAQEKKDIMFMLYVEGGWALFIFLLLLLYFPKKPPLPPSVSASQRRETFLMGLKTLLRRRGFWVITLVYGLSYGISDCWSGVVDIIVKPAPYNLTEKQAGWMGFYGLVSQLVLSMLVARFADMFSKHYKIFIFVMYVIAGGCFVCFGLMFVNVVPFSVGLLYTMYVAACGFLYGAQPLIFELSGELAYPVSEATTNSVLTLTNNIVGLVFLFVPEIPNIGTAWMNWTMIGAVAVSLPAILLLREHYYRLEVDEQTDTKTTLQY